VALYGTAVRPHHSTSTVLYFRLETNACWKDGRPRCKMPAERRHWIDVRRIFVRRELGAMQRGTSDLCVPVSDVSAR